MAKPIMGMSAVWKAGRGLCLGLCLLWASSSSSRASVLVEESEKLATVTLHTESLASKRVYLAADFEAKQMQGVIACTLTVRLGAASKGLGGLQSVSQSATLLPGEKVPFQLGLFPSDFHASSPDVQSRLTCRRVHFFDKPLKSNLTLKSAREEEGQCCQLSPFRIACARSSDEGEGRAVPSRLTEVSSSTGSALPPCFPESP